MYISTPPNPEVENFQIKIYYPAGDWTPDPLNQGQLCYHLSQRGSTYVEKAYSTVDRDWSVGWDDKLGGPLGAFQKEQAMSLHRVSPSSFFSSSSCVWTRGSYASIWASVAVHMLRRHIVLLIAICLSDGTLSLMAPLVLFEKSRLCARTGFHLLPFFHHPSLNTITLHIQLP